MRITLIDIKRMSLVSYLFYSVEFEWLPILHKKLTILKKKNYDIFHFNLSIVCFHANLKFLQYSRQR